MKKLFLICILSFTYLLLFIGCEKAEATDDTGAEDDEVQNCNFNQWTGTANCSDAGYYPVYTGSCCRTGYPYFNTATNNCYTTACAAKNANPGGTIYKINTAGGSGNGGGNGGGGGGTGSKCTNMNAYVSATATKINNCGSGGNNDLSVRVTNKSTQTLYIRIIIKKNSGVFDCGGVTVKPGEYGTYWSCNASEYRFSAILNSEFGNGCFGTCSF